MMCIYAVVWADRIHYFVLELVFFLTAPNWCVAKFKYGAYQPEAKDNSLESPGKLLRLGEK